MQKIFSTTEIEKPANKDHLQAFEMLDENDDVVDESAAAEVLQNATPDDNEDLSVFKKAKEEMSRLGLTTLDEYFEYRTFKNDCKNAAKNQRIWEM